MTAPERLVHGVALALAVDPDGPLFGVLLTGPAGSGKTGLALSAVARCRWARTALVADDAVRLVDDGEGICARAPERIAGLAELRGFGPVAIRSAPSVRLKAGFDLGADAPRIAEPLFDPLDRSRLLPIYPFRAGSDGASRLFVAARAILARTGR